MDSNQTKPNSEGADLAAAARIRVPEIAKRLDIGRLAVYALLEGGVIPGVRLKSAGRWLVTRHAYLEWERTAGRNTSGKAAA
jgi:hypothetical protein